MLDLALLMAASVAAATAPTATFSAIDGTVLVSHGQTFVTVTAVQALAPGDRVLVMEGASATLSHANGCVVALEPGTLVEIAPNSECVTMLTSATHIGPLLTQAETYEEREAIENETAAKGATSTGVLIRAGVVLAAVAIGGGGGDDVRPTSP